jgi:hypothetical protein
MLGPPRPTAATNNSKKEKQEKRKPTQVAIYIYIYIYIYMIHATEPRQGAGTLSLSTLLL